MNNKRYEDMHYRKLGKSGLRLLFGYGLEIK